MKRRGAPPGGGKVFLDSEETKLPENIKKKKIQTNMADTQKDHWWAAHKSSEEAMLKTKTEGGGLERRVQ